MIFNLKNISLFVLGLALASNAMARSRQFGVSGCGLGSQLFKDKHGQIEQVLSSTTNGTSANQTFGITSGTSNCTDDGTVSARNEAPMFIETNQVALATDVAKGNGQTLSHLSKVLGCENPTNLNDTLKKNYSTIFSTANIKAATVTQSLLDTVRNDEKLAHECTQLI